METVKTVSRKEYEHERRRLDALLEERTCVPKIKEQIWFVDYNMGDTPRQLLVNFCCLGAVSPLEAARYAECIKEAADLAMNFKYNGFIID